MSDITKQDQLSKQSTNQGSTSVTTQKDKLKQQQKGSESYEAQLGLQDPQQQSGGLHPKRKQLTEEKDAILSAKSFTEIAGVIDRSPSPKKGEAAIKLRNTDRGVDRARNYFKSKGMAKEEQAFIDDRYQGALEDQKNGIALTLDKPPSLANLLKETDDTKLQDADYSNLQWNAVFGKNKDVTLKQELLDTADVQKTADVVKQQGGLAKLIGLDALWKSMDDQLKQLWSDNEGGMDAGLKAWKAQTIAGKSPAIKPATLKGSVVGSQFAPYGSLDKAFPAPTNGCMGMGQDYQFKNLTEACNALGLRPDWYVGGAFIVSIPTGNMDAAVQETVKAGGGIGKATVFTSLMFSEFNYICEDRSTNETESGDSKVNPNAKQNSGKKSAGGKTEVVVTKLPASQLFAQSPQLLL